MSRSRREAPLVSRARPCLVVCGAALALAVPRAAAAQFVRPRVVVHAPSGPVEVAVEVARTPTERARGLMFREHLDERSGMLFVFAEDADHSFWMKNTYIPLDMIFISRDGLVVGVIENAQPLTTESLRVGSPSRYVLEVPAGFARRYGVGPGVAVEFAGIERAPASRGAASRGAGGRRARP